MEERIYADEILDINFNTEQGFDNFAFMIKVARQPGHYQERAKNNLFNAGEKIRREHNKTCVYGFSHIIDDNRIIALSFEQVESDGTFYELFFDEEKCQHYIHKAASFAL